MTIRGLTLLAPYPEMHLSPEQQFLDDGSEKSGGCWELTNNGRQVSVLMSNALGHGGLQQSRFLH